MTSKNKTVLVTGISGWIAQFCALALLKEGYKVRGSLRSMQRKDEVIKALNKEVDINNNLEFCSLDLLKDDGWDSAMQDCEYVLHVASPFSMTNPKDENDMIKPAKEGTLRTLKSAKKAGVKRVVITSSIVAMAAHLKKGTFNTSSWTDLNATNLTAYEKSKTIAEKSAWDFIKNQDGGDTLELSVVSPGAVMGPTLSEDIEGTSLAICTQILTKQMPALPNIAFPMVDVRDVAKHHIQAMIHPDANGKRFISAEHKPTSMQNMASILKSNGYDVPTKKMPSLLVKIMGLFNEEAKGMVSYLDRYVTCDNSDTINTFNWTPTPLEKTFLDMAKSVQSILKNQ